jgi:hypothetical protein
VAALAGWLVCHVAGYDPHLRELVIATTVAAIAGEAALLPAILARRTDTATMTQAALGGTAVQMLVMLGLTVAAVATGLVHQRNVFVWWILTLYWFTLVIVVVGLVGLIRSTAQASLSSGAAGRTDRK